MSMDIRRTAGGFSLLSFVMTLLALTVSPQAVIGQDWQLVWSDEFEQGSQPDADKWSYQVGGGGWGNQELQYYTDARPENARIEDGVLIIEARNESFSGSTYTSARLRTLGKGDWLYGRFEIRARLPEGLGTWPAIWMMPSEGRYGSGGWPDNGEIDIMEGVGHEPDRTHSNIHVNALNHQLGNSPGATHIDATSRTEFHVYAMEWTPTTITTYVDDDVNLVYQRGTSDWTRWPFDQSFHLILNMAVGGTWGGQQGVDPADYPARFEIDYVRVFEDAAGPPDVSVGTADARLQFDPGERIDLVAEASDPVSDIAELMLYQGDGLLASASNGALQYAVNGAQPGCYSLIARALDSDGWTARSDTLSIRVGPDCLQAPYLMVAPEVPGRVEAEYFDLGGPGVAFQDLTQSSTVADLRPNEAVDVGFTDDIGGGYQVEDVTFREWVEYTVHVTQSGFYRMIARLAATKDGLLHISVDGERWPEDLAYASTNSRTFYRNAPLEGIWLDEGIRTIRIEHSTFGAYINRYDFELMSGTATEALPTAVDLVSAVYPNPFTGPLTVEFADAGQGSVTVRLLDLLGREVFRQAVPDDPSRGNTLHLMSEEPLSPGLYVLVIQSGTTTWTKTVMRL